MERMKEAPGLQTLKQKRREERFSVGIVFLAFRGGFDEMIKLI